MHIFAAVKAAVTTREAAVFYGLRVLPFLKELSKRNSQSMTKQREC